MMKNMLIKKCWAWLCLGLFTMNLQAAELKPIVSFTSSIPGSPIFRDGYGENVRFNGDWAFVVSSLARPDGKVVAGAIYVYKRGKNGYKETQIITTSGTSDHLGSLNIISKDDWLLVSAVGTPIGPIPDDTLSNQNFTGSVQIYHLENGKWVFHSALDRFTPGLAELSIINPTALDPLTSPFLNEQGANFGLNFSINWPNRVLLVGAQYQANLSPSTEPLINVGAVYSFYFDEKKREWILNQKITNPDGTIQNDAFGANVVTDGNYALISNGPILQLPKPSNSFVYVFKRNKYQAWEFIQKLHGDQLNTTQLTIAASGTPITILPTGDAFGNTLELKHGHAIIGAPQENLGGSTIRGAVYFYRQSENGKFKKVFKAVSQDPNSQRFGFPTIRLHGNKAYISDTTFSGSQPFQGAIAVYSFKKNKWHSEGNLVNPQPIPYEFFGESFDIQKKRIGVGTGLLNAGFVDFVSGTPPLLGIPLPYYEHTPFTIYKIKKD